MGNLMDYLKWRGDLDFQQSVFNDVDAAVLSMLCYMDAGQVPEDGSGNPLSEMAARLRKARGINRTESERLNMLRVLAPTRRFGQIRVLRYVNRVDAETSLQFSASLYQLPGEMAVLAFRGTDSTLVGWREDLMMSYETPVLSQTLAVETLERAVRCVSGPLRLLGHSKGGNLASYAAAHASPETQARILSVHSFDGPGLDDETTASEGYRAIAGRLHLLIPQGSVIGLLMDYHPEYTIVRSDASGMTQHDVFSWQVCGPDFITVEDTSFTSQLMDRTLHDWLNHCTKEQRRVFVDSVFRLLESMDASTTAEMKRNFVRKLPSLVQTFRELDNETRNVLILLGGRFVSLSATNAWNMGAGKELQQLVGMVTEQLGVLKGNGKQGNDNPA